ncbi:tryptophan synthase subunit alpha [Prolixibacteraceae bacterium JC049]|nr:tryptophan synthase subunit alpha [Prolixibacteraceae bacterium JC049]
MDNRIDVLFREKKENVLTIYFPAGFPELNDTLSILVELEKAGADVVEIGIPFSDPLADGETIEMASQKALQNGISLKLLFEQLKEMRKYVSIPVLLMGYLNPVYRYGIEQFCVDCKAVGIDGVILPDLPMREYRKNYQTIFHKNGLKNVPLITPQTPVERIEELDKEEHGFIYVVASSATTGAKSGISKEQEDYFARIKALQLKTPTQIGFGIADSASFNKACEFTSGAIIGSAFVKAIQNGGELAVNVKNFVEFVKVIK